MRQSWNNGLLLLSGKLRETLRVYGNLRLVESATLPITTVHLCLLRMARDFSFRLADGYVETQYPLNRLLHHNS